MSVEVTSFTVVDTSSSSTSTSPQSSRENRRNSRGSVYRITPDGLWDQLWESHDDAPYDLTFAADGALIVGTGNKGKIYRLDGDPVRPTLIARGTAQQITAFYKDARGRTYYATANPGKLFRLAEERATRGTYESEPRDAQMVSTWGTISWRGVSGSGNQIEVSTRSGNTETPDDTWSPWSAAYKSADGSAVTSPKARYLQWRAVLTGGKGEGPVLTSITCCVPPAQHAAAGPFDHRPPAWHRLSEAVHDRRTGPRRLRRSNDAGPQARVGGDERPDGEHAGARATHLSKGTPDAHLEGRRRERRRPRLQRALPSRGRNDLEDAAPGDDRFDSRLGHDDGAQRNLLREGGGVGRTIEPGGNSADGRTRQRRARDRQHTARTSSSAR